MHEHGVNDVTFSEDEKLVATVGNVVDKQIIVWDMSNGMIVANKYAAPDPTDHVTFGSYEKDVKKRSTGNYCLVAAGANSLRRWVLNPMSGDFSSEGISLGAQVRDYTDIQFSPGGDFFYAASTTGNICGLRQHVPLTLSTSTLYCADSCLMIPPVFSWYCLCILRRFSL